MKGGAAYKRIAHTRHATRQPGRSPDTTKTVAYAAVVCV
jgi:hypothetical protein